MQILQGLTKEDFGKMPVFERKDGTKTLLIGNIHGQDIGLPGFDILGDLPADQIKENAFLHYQNLMGDINKTGGLTHFFLVKLAYKWLLKRAGCGIAFKELKSAGMEIPDAIGFFHGGSIVIECKVSRSDFLQDLKKPHRKKGMGLFRYYMCPVGLIKESELPKKWGLLYIMEDNSVKAIKNVRKIRTNNDDPSLSYWQAHYPNAFIPDLEAEQKLLYSALRRLFIKGYVKHIYDKDYSTSSDADSVISNNE